jgi:hypothetical protein
MKKPFIRFAHLRVLFLLLRMNASIQRIAKTKPSRFHAKAFSFVGVAGFEPATLWSQTRCANRAALHPVLYSQAFFDIRSLSKGCSEGALFTSMILAMHL